MKMETLNGLNALMPLFNLGVLIMMWGFIASRTRDVESRLNTLENQGINNIEQRIVGLEAMLKQIKRDAASVEHSSD